MNKQKVKTYEVYCDFDISSRVQRFATRWAAERTIIEVRSHRRLLRADPLVIIKFKTNGGNADIYKNFIEEFKDGDLDIEGTTLFVFKRKDGSL